MIQQYMENNGLKFSRSPITYGIKVIDSLLKDGDDDFQKVIDKLSRVDWYGSFQGGIDKVIWGG